MVDVTGKSSVSNRLLLIKFWRSQKLYSSFWLHGEVSTPSPHIVQGSTVFKFTLNIYMFKFILLLVIFYCICSLSAFFSVKHVLWLFLFYFFSNILLLIISFNCFLMVALRFMVYADALEGRKAAGRKIGRKRAVIPYTENILSPRNQLCVCR